MPRNLPWLGSPPMPWTAKHCLRTSLTATIITFTDVPAGTTHGSGRILRRYLILDCAFQQTRSISFAGHCLARHRDAVWQRDTDDRGSPLGMAQRARRYDDARDRRRGLSP